MQREREVEYEHTVQAWTVGDLRRALADVPDDAQLIIEIAEEPGGKIGGPTQVIISGGWLQEWVPPTYTGGQRVDGYLSDPRITFQLGAEFPSGTYVRYVDDVDDWTA